MNKKLMTDAKHTALKQYFGHDAFRGGQEDVIDHLLAGQDVLCVMPTGAGKSMCYQIPALLFSGITIIVSPLISLMNDQVRALVQAGVPAAYLNSALTPRQCQTVLERLAAGRYKLIYVAPERLCTPSFLAVCERISVSMIAVDEAHCISQWGQDFRPSYLKIAEFISAFPTRPVVGAFTATATDTVKEDILRLLQLRTPFSITTGFDRPNLYFGVIQPEDKAEALRSIAEARRDMTGIVYCATRKTVEEVCAQLCAAGFSATRYHAGLPEEERTRNQEAFVYDEKRIMVATNAFGMGIDKSDVRYVVHYNMPKNMESYYQEAGRAGRDGGAASCILLYSEGDVRTAQFLIDNGEPNPELSAEEQETVRRLDYQRLRAMKQYCTRHTCLRGQILRYFGESVQADCGNCSVCNAGSTWETRDCTEDAQKLLSCVIRTGQRYGVKLIIDILRGSKGERIRSLGFDTLPTFGIMRGVSEKEIRQLCLSLEDGGYLQTQGDEYPILRVTQQGRSFLSRRETIFLRMPKREVRAPVSAAGRGGSAVRVEKSDPLYNALRILRTSFAAKEGVPAYVIFHDSVLEDMCRKMPRNREEFLQVQGVGEKKAEKFGDAFLRVIQQYR